jgi:hypothetical protein
MMKKLSFLSMALVAGLSVSAQSSLITEAPAKISKQVREFSVEVSNTVSNRVDIWTNGFDNPADWVASTVATDLVQVGWAINDTVIDNWIGFTNTSFQLRDGNFAFVSNGDPAIEDDEDANYATPGATHSLTLASAIDVTGYENKGFGISFDIDGAKFTDDLQTYVSGNNGQTWTRVGDLTDITGYSMAYPYNDINSVSRFYPVNPIDFGGSSDVLIRFTWDGLTNGGNANGTTYGMFIDNIVIEELPGNDLEMLSFEAVMVRDTTTYLGWALGQEPVDVASERWFMAVVKNNSSAPKSVYISLDITADNNIITVDNIADTISIGQGGGIDTIFINYAPAQFIVGDYAVSGTAVTANAIGADITPANNTRPSMFSITNNTWASVPRNYEASIELDNQFDTDDDGVDELRKVDYYYRWYQFEEITYRNISTAFTETTEVGAKFSFGIYGTTETGRLDQDQALFEGSNYKLENGTVIDAGVEVDMRGARRSQFQFLSPDIEGLNEVLRVDTVVVPGDPLGAVYAANIRLPSDAIAGIVGARTGLGQGNRQGSLMSGPFGEGGALSTFLSSGINVIELGRAESTVSISEIENRPAFYLAQNRPNPFNNGTTIVYQLNKKANNISFEVYDVTGKQVMVINGGSRGAGQYNINLDGSEFTTGLYYYSLTVNGQKLTRKMVVTE